MVWVLDNACMVLICLWSPPSLLIPGYGLTVELTACIMVPVRSYSTHFLRD
jgi:hypothetical protein